jgi:hypothetical protein
MCNLQKHNICTEESRFPLSKIVLYSVKVRVSRSDLLPLETRGETELMSYRRAE